MKEHSRSRLKYYHLQNLKHLALPLGLVRNKDGNMTVRLLVETERAVKAAKVKKTKEKEIYGI